MSKVLGTFKPKEEVMMGAAVALPEAGISLDLFNPAAPLAACRLCGKVFQTVHHRQLFRDRQRGIADSRNEKLLQLVIDLGMIWREKHTRAEHTDDEVNKFNLTGWAFTPQAAKVLAPFGIVPLGNMHEEIIDAMATADRKPDLTLLEGGE